MSFDRQRALESVMSERGDFSHRDRYRANEWRRSRSPPARRDDHGRDTFRDRERDRGYHDRDRRDDRDRDVDEKRYRDDRGGARYRSDRSRGDDEGRSRARDRDDRSTDHERSKDGASRARDDRIPPPRVPPPRDDRRARRPSPPSRRDLADNGSKSVEGAADVDMRDQPDEEHDADAAMAAMMGFSGFSSTQGEHVDGNDEVGTANVKKQRKWRQYMNRRGGFNRPLDRVCLLCVWKGLILTAHRWNDAECWDRCTESAVHVHNRVHIRNDPCKDTDISIDVETCCRREGLAKLRAENLRLPLSDLMTWIKHRQTPAT